MVNVCFGERVCLKGMSQRVELWRKKTVNILLWSLHPDTLMRECVNAHTPHRVTERGRGRERERALKNAFYVKSPRKGLDAGDCLDRTLFPGTRLFCPLPCLGQPR